MNLGESRDRHIEILHQCAAWAEQGLIKIHIGRQLSLEAAVEAHQMIESGHTTGENCLSL